MSTATTKAEAVQPLPWILFAISMAAVVLLTTLVARVEDDVRRLTVDVVMLERRIEDMTPRATPRSAEVHTPSELSIKVD